MLILLILRVLLSAVTVAPSPVLRVQVNYNGLLDKPALHEFFMKKLGYLTADVYGPFPRTASNTFIFCTFKHLHNGWVAEVGSFRCGIVGNCRRLSACVYSFQLSAVFHICNYFQPRKAKTALCKTGRATGNPIQPPLALVYKSLPYTQ